MASQIRALAPWFAGRRLSFAFAFQGLRRLFAEPNVKIHALISVAVICAGHAWRISPTEWALIVIAIAGVWVAEAVNTAIELLANAAVPEHHPLVGAAKDVAACAVLIAALAAAVIGAIVFAPRLSDTIRMFAS